MLRLLLFHFEAQAYGGDPDAEGEPDLLRGGEADVGEVLQGGEGEEGEAYALPVQGTRHQDPRTLTFRPKGLDTLPPEFPTYWPRVLAVS